VKVSSAKGRGATSKKPALAAPIGPGPARTSARRAMYSASQAPRSATQPTIAANAAGSGQS
jgi:hypothetical protein